MIILYFGDLEIESIAELKSLLSDNYRLDRYRSNIAEKVRSGIIVEWLKQEGDVEWAERLSSQLKSFEENGRTVTDSYALEFLTGIKSASVGAELFVEITRQTLEVLTVFGILDNKVVEQEAGGCSLLLSLNGVNFKMIMVEGGEMGTYYIGETQVTQALWETVMKDNPSSYKGPNKPVECVSWTDIKEKFIPELNKQLLSQLPEGYRFALPTEAQWKYAAKGGRNSHNYQYSGCNEESELEQYAWYDKNAYYCGASSQNSRNQDYGIHEVKTRRPNELGIYDMSGNVWEWCEDLYSLSGLNHVLRGGSWYTNAECCEVVSRLGEFNYKNGVGFRLALVQAYKCVRDFFEKRAAVMKDGQWGFIDETERLVIPCIYSKVGDFSEGVAYYEKPLAHGGKYTVERGFIDCNGKQVLSLTENYSGYGLEFDNKFNCGLFKIFSRVHAEWINHEGRIVQKYQGHGRDGSGHDYSVKFGDIIDGVALGEMSVSHVVHYSPQNEEEEQMSSDFFGAFTGYDITHLRFDVKRNIIEEYEGTENNY